MRPTDRSFRLKSAFCSIRSLLIGNISVPRHLQFLYPVDMVELVLWIKFKTLSRYLVSPFPGQHPVWSSCMLCDLIWTFRFAAYHVTEGFGCPYARHLSVAGAPRLRYISASKNVKDTPHKFFVTRPERPEQKFSIYEYSLH